jgi:hypothetical protein
MIKSYREKDIETAHAEAMLIVEFNLVIGLVNNYIIKYNQGINKKSYNILKDLVTNKFNEAKSADNYDSGKLEGLLSLSKTPEADFIQGNITFNQFETLNHLVCDRSTVLRKELNKCRSKKEIEDLKPDPSGWDFYDAGC